MFMYVGNATKQHHDFIYSVPNVYGELVRRMQRIEVGGQIRLSGELEQNQIDRIINDHAPYGFIPVSEVDHAQDYIGLCYSIGKDPIRADVLHRLMLHNNQVLSIKGKELRKIAALAGNEQIEQNLQNSGREERLNYVETTIVEDNHDDRDLEPALAEGYRMTRTEPVAPTTRRARRKK